MLAVKMCWGISCSHFCLTDTLLSQMKLAVLANSNLSINKSTSVKNVLLSCWEKQWVWMMHRPELFVLIMLCTLLQWPELESKTHNYKQDITVSKYNSQSFILLVLRQMKIMTEWTRKKKREKMPCGFSGFFLLMSSEDFYQHIYAHRRTVILYPLSQLYQSGWDRFWPIVFFFQFISSLSHPAAKQSDQNLLWWKYCIFTIRDVLFLDTHFFF